MSKLRSLPILPAMQCDSDCGDCCQSFAIPEADYQKIRRYVKTHNIKMANRPDDPTRCPFHYNDTCNIYDVRPEICRIFGHLPTLKCSRDYNVNVDSETAIQIDKAMKSRGVATRLLHELLNEGRPGAVDVQALWQWLTTENPNHLKRVPQRKTP